MMKPSIPKIRVVVISDDWYYLLGLYIALSRKSGLFVECVFIQDPREDLSQNRHLRTDHSFRDNVLLIAVDNVSIVRTISEFPLFRPIVSVRNLKNRNVVFSFLNTVLLGRYLSVDQLYCLLVGKKGGEQVRKLHLTPYEQHIAFSYFRQTDRESLRNYLSMDIKSISHHKMSVFRKLRVNSNAEAYFIIRAVIEVNTGVRVSTSCKDFISQTG